MKGSFAKALADAFEERARECAGELVTMGFTRALVDEIVAQLREIETAEVMAIRASGVLG